MMGLAIKRQTGHAKLVVLGSLFGRGDKLRCHMYDVPMTLCYFLNTCVVRKLTECNVGRGRL